MPEWERVAWKAAFDVWGPLDWRREDVRDAFNVAIQTGSNIEECVLYGEPERKKESSVDDIMKKVGAA